MMLRRGSLIALLLLLAGCATQTVPPAAKSAIRNVAVISLIGNEVTFNQFGLLVFDRSEQKATFDFGLDGLATEAVEKAMRRGNPGFGFTRLPYDRAALDAIYRQDRQRTLSNDFADPVRIEVPLRALVAGTPVDTIVLVTRSRMPDHNGVYQPETGPGLNMSKAMVGFTMRVLPFAILQLHVVEVQSMRRIAQHTEIAEERKYADGGIFNMPPQSPITKSITFPLAPEEEAFVRGELRRIIPLALDGMVTKVGL